MSAYRGRPIAERGVQSLALRGAEIAAQGLLIVVTARFLGAEGRGLYALASLTATLCIVPLGSVWSSLAVDVAKRRQPLDRLVTDAVVVAGVGGAVVGALALAISPAFGEHWWVVALPAAVTPVLLWLTYVQGLYQSLGHVVAFHGVLVGRVVSPLTFLAVALALGADARGALVAWAGSFLALVPPVAVHLLRLSGRPARPLTSIHHYLRRIALGARFVPTNVVLMLSVQTGLVFLAALATTATVGVYSVAVAGVELLKTGARAIYSSVLSDVGRRDAQAAAELTARAVRHSILLGVAGSAFAVPAAALVVPPLFGSSFAEVPVLLALLAPSLLAYGVFLAVTAFFSVQTVRPEVMTVAAAVLLVATIACMTVFVGPFGAAGAALATSIGTCIGTAVIGRSFLRASGYSPAALLPGRRELADYASLLRGISARLCRRRVAPATEGA
jgi:O-antigen/teichoic acid export membrane protein